MGGSPDRRKPRRRMILTSDQLVDPAGPDLHVRLYIERYVVPYAERHIRSYTDTHGNDADDVTEQRGGPPAIWRCRSVQLEDRLVGLLGASVEQESHNVPDAWRAGCPERWVLASATSEAAICEHCRRATTHRPWRGLRTPAEVLAALGASARRPSARPADGRCARLPAGPRPSGRPCSAVPSAPWTNPAGPASGPSDHRVEHGRLEVAE